MVHPDLNVVSPIFGLVKSHLLAQGQRSLMPERNALSSADCAYRGIKGMKCAIGCLIADQYYTTELEGKYAGNTTVINVVLMSLGYPKLTREQHFIDFLGALQTIHDRRPVEDWEQLLDEAFLSAYMTPKK